MSDDPRLTATARERLWRIETNDVRLREQVAEALDEIDRSVDRRRAELAALKSAIRTLLADVEPADLPGRGPQLLIVRALIAGGEDG